MQQASSQHMTSLRLELSRVEGVTIARMRVGMIYALCNLIKCYYYVVNRLSWGFVMMMMILIIESHYASLSYDVRPPLTRTDTQDCSKVIVNTHRRWL